MSFAGETWPVNRGRRRRSNRPGNSQANGPRKGIGRSGKRVEACLITTEGEAGEALAQHSLKLSGSPDRGGRNDALYRALRLLSGTEI